jgi:hypothetical protein
MCAARRGRIGKVERDRILQERSEEVVQDFRLHPLSSPIDANFEPAYQQFLKGDMLAILKYCDVNATQRLLANSFYELIGRLVTIRFYLAADIVLEEIERRGVMYWPSSRKTYDHWYEALKPLCRRARKFLKDSYRSDSTSTRDERWRDYVSQTAPGESGNENWRTELVGWSETHYEETVRSRFQELGCSGRELELLTKSTFHLTRVNKFRPWGLVTREIFFDLASTRYASNKRPFVLTPATVARRYACHIVRVSESWASRRDVRKS